MWRLALTQKSRAVVASVCAHATLVPLLMAAGGFGRVAVPPTPIIEAELVALSPAQSPAAHAPTADPPSDEVTVGEPPLPRATLEAVAPAVPEPPVPAPTPEPATPEPLAADTTPAEPVVPAAPTSRSVEPVTAAASTPAMPVAEELPAPSLPTVGDERASQPAAPAQRPLDPDTERLLGPRIASWTGRFEPDAPAPTLSWRQDDQEFTAVLRRLPAGSNMDMEQLAVDVTTEREGERLQTELRMTRLAFSNFAQFVDFWDRDVQIHDDEIDGRFHSNSAITVSRADRVQPIFRGRVTLAARDRDAQSGSRLNRRAMFPAGLEAGVRRITLPERAVHDEVAADGERLQRFERDATITFYADGSYGWRDREGGGDEQRRALGADPHYLIGGDDVTFHVAGTLNGIVLVYTGGNIVIADDLRYAVDPRAADADDYLGLVAERVVEIGAPDSTGPGDLEVHASIYARRQFAVSHIHARRSGTLFIVGSVTAGSITATEPRFATKIEFDERLTTMRAPGFPLSDRYELTSWSGEWRRVPD